MADYQNLYPEEYQQLMKVIRQQKGNLKTEYAEIKETQGKGGWRALFTISEKLSIMIALKLDEEERLSFKERENQRWFCKEFPQFAISA